MAPVNWTKKPLIHGRIVAAIAERWINSRGMVISLPKRLSLAASGEKVEPVQGPLFDPDDPESVRELGQELQSVFRGKVAASCSLQDDRGPVESKPKRKRLKPREAALKIQCALDSLAERDEWNAPEREIIKRAGVARSTYYSVLKHDEATRRTMDAYHRRRLGKGPVRVRDI